MPPRFYDAKNGIAFRKLFALEENKPLLISFLNTVLRRKDDDIIEEVEILPPELVPDIAEAKQSILDVRCRDRKNFQYVVEMQNRKIASFIQRAQYYASRTYVDQAWQGDPYLELRPVILLAILNHQIFPDDVEIISYHHTLETQAHRHYLKDISYAFIELGKFTKSWGELKNLEDQWLYLFKRAHEAEAPPPHASREIVKAYKVLEQFNWTAGEREAYERARMSIMDDQGALQTAIEEGRKEGKEEGREEEKRAMVKAFFSQGVDIHTISKATGFSQEEIKKTLS